MEAEVIATPATILSSFSSDTIILIFILIIIRTTTMTRYHRGVAAAAAAAIAVDDAIQMNFICIFYPKETGTHQNTVVEHH